MNAAAEEFFSKNLGGSSKSTKSSGAPDSKKIEIIFNQFKDASTGNMEAEGIEAFYSQIGIDAENDTTTFLISYYMKAKTMGSHTLEEFTTLFLH
jgi:hypothetical protein